ncbi:hypothetical protein ATL39_0898 [Sinobaca qinghaiensis]|uniref:Uncharacterized protein n=1 Tax=Sinobaca qinghaiensis TaxID=342944 RepID=A0A419V5G0_9BACL|nr:hypothetical protein [Sinobaca qinghaiensis]RKD75200.1 hypothetical protein ATL39_0898 [Sinobaca qinghaiensis]
MEFNQEVIDFFVKKCLDENINEWNELLDRGEIEGLSTVELNSFMEYIRDQGMAVETDGPTGEKERALMVKDNLQIRNMAKQDN